MTAVVLGTTAHVRKSATGKVVAAAASSTKSRGVSTLMYACQQGDVDKVRRLLRVQVSVFLRRSLFVFF